MSRTVEISGKKQTGDGGHEGATCWMHAFILQAFKEILRICYIYESIVQRKMQR